MKKPFFTAIFLFGSISIVFAQRGLPKELWEVLDSRPKEMVELPIEYGNVFPTATFEQYDKDFKTFDVFLTRDIAKTQTGLSYIKDGVQTWFCAPAVRTHVQLDTTTMISDNNAVVGNWRIACNRIITYQDSAVYADKKFYRTSKLIKENKDADAVLSLTSEKFTLYTKEPGDDSFKKVANKNYRIENKRYLMLYGLSKAGAAVSFIGIDKNGYLIINNFHVEERKVKGIYLVYQATMTQLVLKKMTP